MISIQEIIGREGVRCCGWCDEWRCWSRTFPESNRPLTRSGTFGN